MSQPDIDERRRFARRWHDELRTSISTDQERRESILRWSLPLIFAALASSAAANPVTADDALWRWLASGLILLVSVETTYRSTLNIIHAAARTERLERLDSELPPFERSTQEKASEEHAELWLPESLKPLWPRPGRSRRLALWYALTAVGAIAYWLLGVSGPSSGQTAAALTLPVIGLLGTCRLFFIGRLHWQRERLVAGSKVLSWVQEGFAAR